jgi:HEAT repeat protein
VTRIRIPFAGLLLGVAVLTGCADFLNPRVPSPAELAQRDMRTLRESRNPEERAKAARDLDRAPEAVPLLIAALGDPDARVRGAAAESLGEMPAASAQSLPPLREAIGREASIPARVDMAWALKQLEADPRDWVPAFRSALGHSDKLTRYNAAVGLVGVGDPVEIFPVVFAELGTEFGREVETRPASVVGDIAKSNDPRLVPLLLEGIRRGNQQQRGIALLSLLEFKPVPIAQIRGPVTAALNDPQPEVREYAAIVLGRIAIEPGQGAEAGPPLVEALRDPSPKVRKMAAMSFVGMRQPPRSAVPVLADLLRDPDAEVRESAALALRAFAPPAREAIPALAAAFGRETVAKVRVSLARVLGYFGPAAREAAPALRAALQDPNATVRTAATQALAQIEGR